MKLRNLGRSPLQVAPLAFGGNVFGWSADEARSFELLDAFVHHGFNLIDTAGAPVLKRVAPIILGVILLIVLRRVLRSRR